MHSTQTEVMTRTAGAHPAGAPQAHKLEAPPVQGPIKAQRSQHNGLRHAHALQHAQELCDWACQAPQEWQLVPYIDRHVQHEEARHLYTLRLSHLGACSCALQHAQELHDQVP